MDHTVNEILMFVVVGFNLFVTNLTILISYTYILATILRMPSAVGKLKAFSTCVSHLAIVTLFYGSAVSMYSRPSSRHSQDLDKVASVFYAMVNPHAEPHHLQREEQGGEECSGESDEEEMLI